MFMAKLTRSGVAHDLTISPHQIEVEYDNVTLVYVFSSELYKLKFNGKLGINRLKINESLSNRFGIKVNFDLLADIKLYSQIETRGFLIKGNEDYKCLDIIELIGVNQILQI